MTLEIRRLQDDEEFLQYLRAATYAFNAARLDSNIERYRASIDRSWCLGAFDGSDLVAGLTIFPFEQHLFGARVPLGGIATVASQPERRREGAVGNLLRASLREMYEAGQVLSGLYTPHYSLYRRFGWEISHSMLAYSFPPKQIRTRQPRPDGTYQRVGAEEWGRLASLREEHIAPRNGAIVRTEQRWRESVFKNDGRGENDAVMWSNARGEDRGYAVYRQNHRPTGSAWGETVLRVVDIVAADGEAYNALLNYLLGHDLVDQIVLVLSEDDPFLLTIEEPTHLKAPNGRWIGMMTRIVDLQGAFSARPAFAAGQVAIEVVDETAPWNAGTWQVSAGDGGFATAAFAGKGQLVLDAPSLAAVFNGSVSVEEAVRAGRIQVQEPAAIREFGAMLRAPYRPFCPDDF